MCRNIVRHSCLKVQIMLIDNNMLHTNQSFLHKHCFLHPPYPCMHILYSSLCSQLLACMMSCRVKKEKLAMWGSMHIRFELILAKNYTIHPIRLSMLFRYKNIIHRHIQIKCYIYQILSCCHACLVPHDTTTLLQPS